MLLEIRVITYNRVAFLNEMLSTLSQSLSLLTKKDLVDVGIVIYDNNSTDTTSEVAKSFCNKWGAKYHKREFTIPNHWFHATTNPLGKFIWIVGDDDLLEACALTKLITLLRNLDDTVDILLLNFGQFCTKNKYVIRQHVKTRTSAAEELITLLGNDSIDIEGFYPRGVFDMLGFIGGNIYRARSLRTYDGDASPETDWDHLFPILRSFAGRRAVIVNTRVLWQRQRNHRLADLTDGGKGASYQNKSLKGFSTLISKINAECNQNSLIHNFWSLTAPFVLDDTYGIPIFRFWSLVYHKEIIRDLATMNSNDVLAHLNRMTSSVPPIPRSFREDLNIFLTRCKAFHEASISTNAAISSYLTMLREGIRCD